MIIQQTKEAILLALNSLAGGNLSTASTKLFTEMGYSSERVLPNQTGALEDFYSLFEGSFSNTLTERDFRNNAKSVHILFQFTDDEINDTFKPPIFETSNAKCFVFAAVQLNGDTYPRGKYAEFAREVNRCLPHLNTPVVVLFRTVTNLITLALVHRRPNKRNDTQAVLGSVSLIRHIDPQKPHRAHREILYDLTQEERVHWIHTKDLPLTFDSLKAAWLSALDTEELNKHFYRKLYDWFERAIETARFPSEQTKTLQKKEHVIRLITRMMFVWFIKEKGLVDADLFDEVQVAKLLNKYDRASGDSYYRAVLQNLFFATLNTEVGQRGVSRQSIDDHRNPSLYRYERDMSNPDKLRSLLNKTPFINGGLFECLDSFDEAATGGYRIDCFSDIAEHYRLLSYPNRLFFGDDENQGLIDIFEHYKFTVEEHTPVEHEVALDPELLGRVFENLLAAVDPDTKLTERKNTGSYYTPRPVVDYMVEQALFESLTAQATTNPNDSALAGQISQLLDHSYAHSETEDAWSVPVRKRLVRTIAELKVLDPAVGSGAFPMSMLQKLTLVLRRLDPNNRLWEQLQLERAAQSAADAISNLDQEARDITLNEITDTFHRYRDSDFGRKLYLIQNSIYGVDIQTIAIQIAKLRFFISLAIEQEPSNDKDDNYGIKPLPNLETRFVPADTLMPLYNLQLGLISDQIQDLEHQLKINRERHFHANTRRQKEVHRATDQHLRLALASELQKNGLGSSDSNKVAMWNPYDQNADHAKWFNAAYMFGVEDGFDIIIGNPPYKRIKKLTYPKLTYPYSEGRDKGKQNLYKLFVEQSYNLCKIGGTTTMIVQKSLMCDESSAGTRQLLLEHTRLRHVIEFPERAQTREAQVFSSVTQGTCIYQFHKVAPDGGAIQISVGNDTYSIANPKFTKIDVATILALWPNLRCFPHIKDSNIAILRKVAEDETIKPLEHYIASTRQGDLNLTTHKSKFSTEQSTVRLLRGDHVSRFVVRHDDASEFCKEGFRTEKVKANRLETFLISQHVMNQQASRRLNFALTKGHPVDFLWGNSVDKTQLRVQENSEVFLALLNSKFLDWYFRITSSNNNVNGYELKQLPIPHIAGDEYQLLKSLVNRILSAKDRDPTANTSALEKKIDHCVFSLFGLTPDEIAIVERDV